MYGEHISWFHRFLQLFQPSVVTVVRAELKDAELAHLHAISKAEYAALRTQTHKLTAEYHAKRAERLQAYLQANDHSIAAALDTKLNILDAMTFSAVSAGAERI